MKRLMHYARNNYHTSNVLHLGIKVLIKVHGISFNHSSIIAIFICAGDYMKNILKLCSNVYTGAGRR